DSKIREILVCLRAPQHCSHPGDEIAIRHVGGELSKAKCEFCAVVCIEGDKAAPFAKSRRLDELGPKREFAAEVCRVVVEVLRQRRIVVGKTSIFIKDNLLAHGEFRSVTCTR